jgi:FkbM family methyltransferase
MTRKPQTEQPFHREITQHESGWWLPAQVGGSFGKWQRDAIEHIDAALKCTKGREMAVQAGCHIGLWATYLADHFDKVRTFEADPVNLQCAAANTNNIRAGNVVLRDAALSDRVGTLPWYRSLSNTGKHRPNVLGRGKTDSTVDAVTVDSLDLPACDLICLDIEGYELAALKGSTATIDKYRPVVLVEDLPHAPWHGLPLGGVATWLKARGYRMAQRVDNDQIWVPE